MFFRNALLDHRDQEFCRLLKQESSSSKKWECLKILIYFFNFFIMYFTDEELQKWKIEDLRKNLLQRGVPIDNNACKANLIEKVIFAQKFDFLIEPSQEHEKEIFNANHNKLRIDDMQIPHSNDIKENRITGSEYLPRIISNSASRDGRNVLFSGFAMPAKFNPITCSLKFRFIEGAVIERTRVNENPYSIHVCIHEDESILTGECVCVAGLMSSCKHIFAILHYIENKVKLGS